MPMKPSNHITVAALRSQVADPAPVTAPLPAEKTGGLRTVTEVRFDNFDSLFERFKLEVWRSWPNEPEKGMLRKFSDRLGFNERYASHLKCRRKGIGNATARKVEEALGLEPGWMDQDHLADTRRDVAQQPADMAPGEQEFIAMASEAFRDAPYEAKSAIMELLLKKARNKAAA